MLALDIVLHLFLFSRSLHVWLVNWGECGDEDTKNRGKLKREIERGDEMDNGKGQTKTNNYEQK